MDKLRAAALHDAVGEYLMMLPQLLESALVGEEEEEETAAQLVADWIDKVTPGRNSTCSINQLITQFPSRTCSIN